MLPNGGHLTFGSYSEESRPLKRTLKQVSYTSVSAPRNLLVFLSKLQSARSWHPNRVGYLHFYVDLVNDTTPRLMLGLQGSGDGTLLWCLWGNDVIYKIEIAGWRRLY